MRCSLPSLPLPPPSLSLSLSLSFGSIEYEMNKRTGIERGKGGNKRGGRETYVRTHDAYSLSGPSVVRSIASPKWGNKGSIDQPTDRLISMSRHSLPAVKEGSEKEGSRKEGG